MKARVCQLFEGRQHEFANFSLPCEGRFNEPINSKHMLPPPPPPEHTPEKRVWRGSPSKRVGGGGGEVRGWG